jgi:hypothetical protein
MSTMHRPLTMWLLAALASANVHPADAVRRPVLLVVLHNYAAIAPRILEQAAREVGRAAGGLMTVAHVLYEPIGDDSTSALALAFVIAHLVENVALAPDGSRSSTIVRAARGEAERLQRGESPFTADEAERIRAGAWSVGR